MEVSPLLLIVLMSPASVYAQDAVTTASMVSESITPAELETHARVITSYDRPSGSDGENAAIDYIESTLRTAGVPVTIHEFVAYTSNPVAATVTVPGSNFTPDAITASFSAATDGLVARVVDVGPLSVLPSLEVGTGERLVLPADHVNSLPDLVGAIALVDGQPRNGPVTVLAELGAVGVLFANPAERLNELIVTSTWGTPSLRNYHRLPTIPVAQIKHSDGISLRAMMGGADVSVRMTVEMDTGWRTLRLPVARIEPAGQVDAPFVLLGGHIDAWHRGGTDEGASNAAMLSMATAFHAVRDRLKRGVVIAWWPGHSNARYGGSTWFADHFFEELRDRAVAYLNIDGVGQVGAKRVSVTGTRSLQQLAVAVVRQQMAVEASASRPGRNSDQSFNGVGLPLLQFNHTRLAEDGGYWWWHTPDDTFDKIDVNILDADTDLYVAAIARLTTEETLPLDLEGQFAFVTAALEARQEASGGRLDLSLAVSRSEQLVRLSRQISARNVAIKDVDLIRVLRPVHRVLYTPLDPFHPDPGRSLGAFPGLAAAEILAHVAPDDDRYHFALTSLVRENNRINEALGEATSLLQALIADDTR